MWWEWCCKKPRNSQNMWVCFVKGQCRFLEWKPFVQLCKVIIYVIMKCVFVAVYFDTHVISNNTSPPKERMRRIFSDARKIQRLRPGLNPRTRVPEISMLTTRPRLPEISMLTTRPRLPEINMLTTRPPKSSTYQYNLTLHGVVVGTKFYRKSFSSFGD